MNSTSVLLQEMLGIVLNPTVLKLRITTNRTRTTNLRIPAYLYQFQTPNHSVSTYFRSATLIRTFRQAFQKVLLNQITPTGLEPRLGKQNQPDWVMHWCQSIQGIRTTGSAIIEKQSCVCERCD